MFIHNCYGKLLHFNEITLLNHMKFLSILFVLASLQTFSQIKGDWKLTATKYNNHPFEKDTLTLNKVENIEYQILNKVNILSFMEFGEALYQPSVSQEIDDTKPFFRIVSSDFVPDTLTKQFQDLKYLVFGDTLQLIFFNKCFNLTDKEIKSLNPLQLKAHYSNFGKSLILYFKVILQTEQQIQLFKLNLP